MPVNVLVLILLLAMGNSSERVSGTLTAYCPDYANCSRGDSYGSIGYYTDATQYAVSGECYPNANISMYDLSILPNDKVIVSCLMLYTDRIVYTVNYESPYSAMPYYDSWAMGIDTMILYFDGRIVQNTRAITMPLER